MTTTATNTAKSLTNDEIKLLNDFTNTVNARNINSANEVQKLHLIYDKETGYTIDLEEAPKEEVAEPVLKPQQPEQFSSIYVTPGAIPKKELNSLTEASPLKEKFLFK